MATETFIWQPDLGADCNEEPLVTVTKFGDGYESRLPTAINSQPQVWTVAFTKNLAVTREIKSFLRRHGASKKFIWTTPDGEPGQYVARKWQTKQIGFGVFQVTTSFEQVFED